MRRDAESHDIHFLHNQTTIIDGVRFLGTPLFADLRQATKEERDAVDGKSHSIMQRQGDWCICGATTPCDLDRFSHRAGPTCAQGQLLGADWFHEENQKARRFLEQELAVAHPRTVVVSHWAPSLKSLPARESQRRAVHAYWASDHEDLVAQSNVWIHGHLHDPCDYRVGSDPRRGRVVCNPQGNLARGMFANPGYDPDFGVEL
jgi:hypothetical protein